MPVQSKRTERAASVVLTHDPAEDKPPVGSAAQLQGAIIQRAVEVIGNEAEALRWMGTPVRALNYATPISLLNTTAGYRAVLGVLGRLEHGIV